MKTSRLVHSAHLITGSHQSLTDFRGPQEVCDGKTKFQDVWQNRSIGAVGAVRAFLRCTESAAGQIDQRRQATVEAGKGLQSSHVQTPSG